MAVNTYLLAWGKKATIHQQTTMLSTSKNFLYPGHNHLLTTGADDPNTLIITQALPRVIIKAKVSWWIVAFLCCVGSLLHIMFMH